MMRTATKFKKGDRVRLTKDKMRRSGAKPCCGRKLGDVVRVIPGGGVVVRIGGKGRRGTADVRFYQGDLERATL